MNAIPDIIRNHIRTQTKYRGKDVQLLEYPLHSLIRFAAVVAAGPPVVHVIAATPRVAFSYGVGQDMAAAGRTGVLATQADTNIQQAGQTRDGSDVFIFGMSAHVMPGSDGELLGDVWRETDVVIATNSDSSTPAGTFQAYPQPGGLTGLQQSAILIPDQTTSGYFDGGEGAKRAFATNGAPHAGSFRRFENPLFWAGLANGSDTNLQVTCTPRRAITKTCALARAAVAGGANTSGTAVFTPPTASHVDVLIMLHCAAVKLRGVNAG